MTWLGILILALGAYGFKLAGVVIGRMALARTGASAPNGDANPPAGPGPDQGATESTSSVAGPVERVGRLLPPALLSALVVSQTVTSGTELVVDARLAGVGAGAIAVALKAPFWVVILLAAAVAALVRLLAG